MTDTRKVLDEVVSTIIADSEGEVTHTDIDLVLNSFGLDSARFYDKVESALDEIVVARKIAQAFRDDPRWAYDKYIGEGGSVRGLLDAGTAEWYEQTFENTAETYARLLVSYGEVFGK